MDFTSFFTAVAAVQGPSGALTTLATAPWASTSPAGMGCSLWNRNSSFNRNPRVTDYIAIASLGRKQQSEILTVTEGLRILVLPQKQTG